MDILIGGDFYVSDNFAGHDLVDQEVTRLFGQAGYRVLNLEMPLTEDIQGNKIFKTGPHLRSSPGTALPFLKKLKVDLVSLANNHILDYGEKGLSDTLTTLDKNGIGHLGAGTDIDSASRPFVVEIDGKSIAFLNFTETEWSAATASSAGASPLDIIDNVRLIRSASSMSDRVIVIIHGGNEFRRLPNPRMVKQYRFYAGNGADAVINHHQHCIGGYEVYNGVPIFYGLGNFLFTMKSHITDMRTGLVVRLRPGTEKVGFEIIPVRQEKDTFTLKLCSGEEKKEILGEVENLNRIITDPEQLINHWEEYLVRQHENYLEHLSPLRTINNQYLRKLISVAGMDGLFRRKQYRKQLLNRIRCEAHRDVTLEVLRRSLEES
jgi:hypothetical protein